MADTDRTSGDNWDNEPGFGRGARFPGIVKAAGVIWIGIGALAIIGSVFATQQAGANPGAAAPTGSCCPGIIGLAFLICGHQTVTGSASDTRGNGAGSLILGILQLLVAAGIAFGGLLDQKNAGGQAPLDETKLLIAGLVAAQGSTLMLAGALALAGRQAYLDWRYENAPQPRKRKRRDEDD